MEAILVRVGIDLTFGNWNAPADPVSGRFVYVPIPESESFRPYPGLGRDYQEIVPHLKKFASDYKLDLNEDMRFPEKLLEGYAHLDPDFENLTYGDIGNRRGSQMRNLNKGDLLVFYAALKPVYPSADRLIYALIGLFSVEQVVKANEVPETLRYENAHTRRFHIGNSDIIIRAQAGKSGRFSRFIPIGEFRNRAYRVRTEILELWGGLSVKDGFIQRSARPPHFLNPAKFYDWLHKQNVTLNKDNWLYEK